MSLYREGVASPVVYLHRLARELLTDHHHHRCGECGHVWGHDGAQAMDNEPAHRCPQCGSGPYWERHRG